MYNISELQSFFDQLPKWDAGVLSDGLPAGDPITYDRTRSEIYTLIYRQLTLEGYTTRWLGRAGSDMRLDFTGKHPRMLPGFQTSLIQ